MLCAPRHHGGCVHVRLLRGVCLQGLQGLQCLQRLQCLVARVDGGVHEVRVHGLDHGHRPQEEQRHAQQRQQRRAGTPRITRSHLTDIYNVGY